MHGAKGEIHQPNCLFLDAIIDAPCDHVHRIHDDTDTCSNSLHITHHSTRLHGDIQ